ncbi:MAG TPA: LCP family protein [Candidatus Saccharimonadales bacterium]|nr:LCP family protein [Candidatus Saccharimonadales bacterium]
MNADFQPQSRRTGPRTVDGFISNGNRRPLDARSLGGRLQGPAPRDELRTGTRTVGNFRRPEGYHASNNPLTTSPANPRQAPSPSRRPSRDATSASMLHATLPGAKPVEKKKVGTFPGAKKGRDWRSIRKWSLRGGLAVLGVLVLLGGFLFTKGFFKANKVFKGGGSAAALNSNVNPSLLKGEGDGRINIMLLGRGGDGHAGSDLTDTILLASIDPVNNKAALVSIPRDLWVSGPRGGSMKINAVYATAKNAYLSANKGQTEKAQAAGIEALEDTVKDVLGVPVHYYSMVDFAAFKQAVDTVGGVDINVPENLAVTERLWDPTTRKQYYLNVPAGQQHFDGTRALFFTRTRHTSTRGDFDRSERQRLFIAALSQKVLSAGTYTNPVKISQLMDDFGDHVATDLSINDAVQLSGIGKKVGGNIESIGLADVGKSFVTTGMISGQSVVLPIAGAGNYSEIQTYVRSKLKDGYIGKENANITVLNGTTMSGLAGQKAEQLKTYGYNIGTVADAPTQDYQETVIVDLTKGKKPYTKNYLQKRYNVKVTSKLPDQTIQPGNASFVIILGSNETTNSSN